MIDVGICKHCGKMVRTDNMASTVRWMDSDIQNHETILVHQTCLKNVDRWVDHVKKGT